MLFCIKCGQECNDDLKVCPNCGVDLAESVAKKKKIRKGFIIAGCIVAVLILGFIGLIIYEDHQDTMFKEKMVSTVQNGYLGNYNMVTVKDVLEYTYEDGTWEPYIRQDNNDMMVEFYDEVTSTHIRFKINKDFSGFKVTYLESVGFIYNPDSIEAKYVLDTFYQSYDMAFPDDEVGYDYTADNDTLTGHVGPIVKTINPSDTYTINEDGSMTKDKKPASIPNDNPVNKSVTDDKDPSYVYDSTGLSYQILDFDTIKYSGSQYADSEVAVKAIYGGDYRDEREGFYGLQQYGGLILNPVNSADNMTLVLDNDSTNFVNAKGVDELSYKNVIVKGYLRLDLETGEGYIEVTEMEATK